MTADMRVAQVQTSQLCQSVQVCDTCMLKMDVSPIRYFSMQL